MDAWKSIVIACWLAATLPAVATPASKGRIAMAPGKQIGPAFIPTFPDVDCQSAARRKDVRPQHELCSSKTHRVQVRVIAAEGDLPSFCIAYMPYNKLTLHMGATPGATTAITWSLDPSSIFEFVDTGVGPAAGSEDAANKLLDLKPVADPKRVTIVTKADAPDKTEVHHLPLVVARVAVGKPVPCVGIDPIIINNAD